MLDSFDAMAARRWCATGLDGLRRHQREIDELNVFPVPDGDTGTNLVRTMTAASQALATHDAQGPASGSRSGAGAPDVGALGGTLRSLARGAVLGARGSSGVIVSQLLRGSADALASRHEARGRDMADALTRAARAGYAAVAEPVEGTMLSVATAAAAAATATNTDDLAAVVTAAARAAAAALARTPEQLPALARAGVVDAGGRGLVVLLDALVEVVTGQVAASAPRRARDSRPLTVAREAGSEQYAYEVQYLLDAPPAAVEVLKRDLAALGDSLVVVGTSADEEMPTWNVHVHVNDIGAAIEAGVQAGAPRRISVTRFADQAPIPPIVAAAAGHDALARADGQDRGLVVVASGSGIIEAFAGEGAVVVDGGPTSSPSTAELIEAIRATGASHVVVFPNDANVHAVASAAAEEARAAGIGVAVVPTRSPIQALAAIAVRDASRRLHDDVIAMAEAAGACRWAEMTFATRAALTVAGQCAAGDVLALVEGEVNLIGHDLAATCLALLDRMLGGGGELVTLVLGADSPGDLEARVRSHLSTSWPFVEVHVISGGQAHHPVLVGVE